MIVQILLSQMIALALVLPSISDWLVALAIGGAGLLLALAFLGSPVPIDPDQITLPEGLRGRANQWFTHWPFIGQRRSQFWAEQLRQAGAPFFPAELYGFALLLASASALLFNALLGYTRLALFLGVVAIGPFLLIRWRAPKNQRLLTIQIETLCLDLTGSAESGSSKMQLLEQAAEAEAPLGPMFMGVLAERDQGVSSLEALENLRTRVKHRQIEGLIQALQVHFERGAPIAPLLREAALAICIEDELIIEIQTRLEQPRVQLWFVCFLSMPVLLYMRWQDPSAVNGLLGSPIGQIYYLTLWGLALSLYLLVRRLTHIERL